MRQFPWRYTLVAVFAFLLIGGFALLTLPGFAHDLGSGSSIQANYVRAEATPRGPSTPTPTPGCTPTWNRVSSPNPGSQDNWLTDVSAVSSADVWTVGYYHDIGNPIRTLVEHWNGSSWAVVISPNVGTGENRLLGVSARASDDVWAVGYYVNTGGVQQTLTMHWNGSVWSIISSPSVGSFDNALEDATILSATDAWAVGHYNLNTGAAQTLTLHWDGTTWSVISSPNPGSQASLSDVDAISASDIWAVGSYNFGSTKTLLLHWNGSTWTQVTGDDPGTTYDILYGVDAIATDDVWAVGVWESTGTGGRTLTLHWDGAVWITIPSPNGTTCSNCTNTLYDVSAVATNDVWAVGNTSFIDPPTLSLHWDGSAWSNIPGPAGVSSSSLYGVAAVASNDVWAVGNNAPGSVQTLIERYAPICQTSTPSSTSTNTTTPTSTNTSTSTATRTPTPSSTPTSTPTGTFFPPSVTSTPTNTPTRTATHTVTGTTTPISTSTPTNTPTRTATRTSTHTVTSTATGVNTPAPAPIVTAIGDQQSAQIDGDFVVWEDNGAGNWDVKAKDLAANVLFPVNTATSDQRYPALSGNLVVWQDNSNGNWDILAAYVTNHVAGAPFDVLVGTNDQTNPAVSGDVVVWQSSQAGRSDILAKNLTTSTVITLTTLTTTNENPAIEGDIVVWQSKPITGGPWQIVGYNLGTSSPFTISQGTFDKTNPDISGSLVVWQEEYATPRWRVAGANISTNATFTAPTSTTNSQVNPAIYGSSVVYQDSHLPEPTPLAAPLVHGRWTVLEWDVTPVPPRVISNNLTRDAINPALASGAIVWEQRPGIGDSRPAQSPSGEDTGSDIYGTVCTGGNFNDVPSDNPFYPHVRWMSCRGYVSGYDCGAEGEPCPGTYFRPNTNVTRGQLAKIISNAAAFLEAIPPDQQTFTDVASDQPFREWIERLAGRGVIGGYPCGGEGEPCDDQDRPYFRPYNSATRGQIAKMASSAAGFDDDIPPTQESFTDVLPDSTFWLWIERLVAHQAIGGYPCGGEGEPCDEENRPYFRPGNNTTRGQLTKIATVAFGGP
jgi:beta propeller repeat protein